MPEYAPANPLGDGGSNAEALYGMSDEEVVDRWVENPYWQKFCGEVYFQQNLRLTRAVCPISKAHWRKWRELILQLTVVGTCKETPLKE